MVIKLQSKLQKKYIRSGHVTERVAAQHQWAPHTIHINFSFPFIFEHRTPDPCILLCHKCLVWCSIAKYRNYRTPIEHQIGYSISAMLVCSHQKNIIATQQQNGLTFSDNVLPRNLNDWQKYCPTFSKGIV